MMTCAGAAAAALTATFGCELQATGLLPCIVDFCAPYCAHLRTLTTATKALLPAAATGGGAAHLTAHLPLTSYKLLHALALCDLGQVAAASAYCHSLNATLQVRCWCARVQFLPPTRTHKRSGKLRLLAVAGRRKLWALHQQMLLARHCRKGHPAGTVCLPLTLLFLPFLSPAPTLCLPRPQALGGKVPPGLLVCRAVMADLQERLQQYALVS